MPQLFGFQLPLLYISFISAIAPIAWLPVILYVSKKSNVQLKRQVTIPDIGIIFLLALLSVSILIISRPLSNPIEYLSNLFNGKLKLVVFHLTEFDWNILIKFIGAVLIAPIFEEIFFRKQILGLLLRKYSPIFSISLSSIFFSVGHFRINEIGILLIWGLLLGTIYYKTKAIEVTILLHSFGNISNFFIKNEFIDITRLQLLKYVSMMLISALVIILIIKYLNHYGIARKLNDPDIPDASLPAGKQ